MKQHSEKCTTLQDCNCHPFEMTHRHFRECDCDGYHTFGELYDHRIALWIALCRALEGQVEYQSSFTWRSKNHSDGEPAFGGGWFVLGIGKENGEQMTYHLPMDRWGECYFAETLDKAPDFDGHTSADVLERLKTL